MYRLQAQFLSGKIAEQKMRFLLGSRHSASVRCNFKYYSVLWHFTLETSAYGG
jgi:hypothetical protein